MNLKIEDIDLIVSCLNVSLECANIDIPNIVDMCGFGYNDKEIGCVDGTSFHNGLVILLNQLSELHSKLKEEQENFE